MVAQSRSSLSSTYLNSLLILKILTVCDVSYYIRNDNREEEKETHEKCGTGEELCGVPLLEIACE